MSKASTEMLEQGTQAPSPAPDHIPAQTSTENLHWDWYNKRGHFTQFVFAASEAIMNLPTEDLLSTASALHPFLPRSSFR
jgi:hypothetical protein